MAIRGTAVFTGLVCVALAVTACDGTTQTSSHSTSPAPSPSATPTPTAGTAGDDPACLVGTWALGEEGMGAYYAQINDLLDGAAEFTPRGDATLTIDADGSYTWAPDAQISALVAGRQMEVALSGTLGGTYTTEPGRIRTDAEVDDQLVVTGTVDGSPVDASDIAQQIGGAPMSDSEFVCGEDVLELTTTVAGTSVTTTLDRID